MGVKKEERCRGGGGVEKESEGRVCWLGVCWLLYKKEGGGEEGGLYGGCQARRGGPC